MIIRFNWLPTLIFIVLMICYFFYAYVFLSYKRRPAAQKETHKAFAILGLIMQSLSYAIVWRYHRPFFSPLTGNIDWLEIGLAIATIALAIASVWIAVAAKLLLGKQWSLDVSVIKDHKLIIVGPYRIVRHPIYTGMFGLLLATALSASRLYPLLAAILVFLLGTILRIRAEEKLLRKIFVKEYEAYAKRVPMFIPFLY